MARDAEDIESGLQGRRLSASKLAFGGVAALAAVAYANHHLARQAEHDNPPAGRFLRIGDVRLHYMEQGSGPPLVLLHGNGSMIQDFQTSGLLDLAATRHRVIVFDRPGYGHSNRPRSTIWSDQAQADLIATALARLQIGPAIIAGHSWGCSVAVALAQRHPGLVKGLVLASGYYYPTARLDVALMSGPALPVIGDVARYTASPLLARLLWPALLKKLFGPRRVPAKFSGFPKGLAVRPSQIRASAEESGLMIPDAASACSDYSSLKIPVAIIAGADDRLIDPQSQSARLHRDIGQSSLHLIPGAGHMIHQTDTKAVMSAIDHVQSAVVDGGLE
nr:alpha/beta hydrolase [Paracoccus saliphilus]